MDETVLCELDDLFNQFVIDVFWVSEAFYIDHGEGLNKTHTNRMAISVVRDWGLKSTFVKGGHKGILFQRCNSGHIQPATSATLQVVTVVFDRSKGCATKTSELYYYRLPIVDGLSVFI
jgi:hypothetical protein